MVVKTKNNKKKIQKKNNKKKKNIIAMYLGAYPSLTIWVVLRKIVNVSYCIALQTVTSTHVVDGNQHPGIDQCRTTSNFERG